MALIIAPGSHFKIQIVTISAIEIENVSAHLSKVVGATLPTLEPAPYIFIENAFPSAFYDRVAANLLTVLPYFQKVESARPDSFESYQNQRILPIRSPQSNPEIPELHFWLQLRDILESKIVVDAIRIKFRDAIATRFGRDISLRQFIRKTSGSLMLAQHGENFYLGPHTDAPGKVVSCIFNCAEHAGLDELGTAMYQPRQQGLACNGTRHHDPSLFIHTHTAPFRPNSALIFVRDDRLFHGVERLRASSLGDSQRMNIQFNLWEKPSLPQRLAGRGRGLVGRIFSRQ